MTRNPLPRRLPWLRATLLLAPLLAAAPLAAQERIRWSRIEQLMQQFDAISPPPPPVEVVEVGTLDATSGTFSWGPAIERKPSGEENPLLTRAFAQIDLPPMVVDLAPDLQITGLVGQLAPALAAPRPRPATGNQRTVNGPATIEARPTGYTGGSGRTWRYFTRVRAGKVDMVFRVVNRPAGAKVSIACEGRQAEADADVIDILAPPRVYVGFSLQCGTQRFVDRLWLDRPPILGYFMLEAFPVAVVYEPPGSGSSQTYAVTRQMGTTVRSLNDRSDSEGRPVATAFSTINDLAKAVGAAGKVVGKAYPAVGEAMEGGSEALTAALGDQEQTVEVTHRVTDEHTLSFELTQGQSVATTMHLGPGRGDVIWYLYHPVFAWLAFQDEEAGKLYLTVSLLGYRSSPAHSAEALRSGTVHEPNAAMCRLLLAHDVLTPEYRELNAGRGKGNTLPGMLAGSGGSGNPAPRRLVPASPAEDDVPQGGQKNFWFERRIESEDVHTESTTTTMTTTETSGFLSFVSDKMPQTGTTSMSVTQTASRGTHASETVRVEGTLAGQPGEYEFEKLRCWYDRLSGTFAYQLVPEGQTSGAVSGSITSSDGTPAGNQEVLLRTADGTLSRTHADANGQFRIRSALLQKGQHVLEIAGEQFQLAFEPGKTPEQQLRLRGTASAPLPGAGKAGSEPVAPGEPFTIGPGEGLKGRMGRLVVQFPAAAPAKGTTVQLFDTEGSATGEQKAVDHAYGSWTTELFAGKYAVVVGGQRVAEVPVERGRQTTLHVGTLRVHAGKGTLTQVLPASGDDELTHGYGTFEAGLPVGRYRVRIHGRTAEAVVTAGAVTEF